MHIDTHTHTHIHRVMQCTACTITPNSKGVQREKIPGDGDTLAKVMLESVTLSSGKGKTKPTHTCTQHAHTHTHTHSAVKISTNPVYYLPPLCTLPLFFILSLSHFLPRSPLLLFFLSLLLKPILVAVARTHRLTHTRCQFTPVMFVGLGLRRGNREGSVDVCCSFPAPALFTSCRENYLPFVCVKGLLPLPSVQRIQWQACVSACACVCVPPCMCMCSHACVHVSVRLLSNPLI